MEEYQSNVDLEEFPRQILLFLSNGRKYPLETIKHVVGNDEHAARYGTDVLEKKYHFISRDSEENFQLTQAGVGYLRINLGIPAKKPQTISREKDASQKSSRQTFSRTIDIVILVTWLAVIPILLLSIAIFFFVAIHNLYLRALPILILVFLLYRYMMHIRQSIIPVKEGMKLVVFREGQYVGTKGPGAVLVAPLFYTYEIVDIRLKEQEIPHQTCITQDNVQIDIDFVYYWQIENPQWSITKVANPEVAIKLLATGILRAVIAKFSFSEVQKKRQTINDDLKEEIDVIIGDWGVNVTSIEIREVKASPEIVKAMEQARTAEWDRETTELRARAEAEALKVLRVVAHNLDDTTLKLKYFEVLRKLGESQSTKYIFPMELSKLVESLINENRSKYNQGDSRNNNSPELKNGNESASG
ncbi:MAG: SPFH domain-containing protein [Anaerolineales bacterium]|nr:MAG: SPFH domain-containing protein [Anaerolineales bacterium]